MRASEGISRVLFRWSIWDPTPESVFMLSHSIGTTRAFFGDSAQYVVHTNSPGVIAANIMACAVIKDYASSHIQRFVDARSTWLKWAPTGRLNRASVEIHMDADVFIVDEPDELRCFCRPSSSHRFMVAQEEFKARWPYGTFGPDLQEDFTPVNAGIVGQQAGVDFSEELQVLYERWKSRVATNGFLYHDEQGAVALLLQPYCRRDEVLLLNAERYRVVCPLNEPQVESLAGMRAIHATYPDHPAFWRFLPEIAAISGLSAVMPTWREA